MLAPCLIVSALLLSSAPASALPVDFYASTSRLASGKWVKVKVADDGMYLIPNADLIRMGFQKPEDVRVYGYGGRMLKSGLNEDMADDLPQAPSVSTDKGLVFYAVGSAGWGPARYSNSSEYEYEANAYSDDSWYFLSDSADSAEIPSSVLPAPPAGSVGSKTFIDRRIHDIDQAYPMESGRRAYGEDFRLNPSQNFRFQLPGNVGDEVGIRVFFGATLSSGTSSIAVTADGKQLPATKRDQIKASTGSSIYVVNADSYKQAPVKGDNLVVGIEYQYSGVLTFARLDYVQVEYERSLALDSGELCFHGNFDHGDILEVSGCDASTVFWDVTYPANAERVNVRLEGGKAYLTPGKGYREFVAFDPSKVTRQIAERAVLANQDIHGMEVPDMVIISPPEYVEASRKIAALHEEEGMKVYVLDPADIYNEFSSGKPDVTAFRRMMKMWYDRGNEGDGRKLRYCMIMSRPTYDNKMVSAAVKNAGYPRVPIWQSPSIVNGGGNNSGNSESSTYSTDTYISMLQDVADDNFNIDNGKLCVAVARIPVKSVAEANVYAEKVSQYMRNPDYGFWRNNVLLIADDQDNGTHLMQSESVYKAMRTGDFGENMAYERLYLDSYPLSYTGTGASYPEARRKLLSKFKEGVGFINYIGHANPREWTHEGLLNWTDIISLENTRMPFLYAATCEYGRIDADSECGAENMLLNPSGGVIGTIVPNRSVYISPNGTQSANMGKIVFDRDEDGKAKSYGDIYLETMNLTSGSNRLRYCLMADPALRLPGCDVIAEVTSLNGVAVNEASGDYPEIKARQSVDIEGVVRTIDGAVDSGFNGVLQLKLYDAETVIETYGNGEAGVAKTYNDRTTMLCTTTAKVENGHWKASVTLPSEIANNYSPAQIICYAYAENGKEANGACEKLYVYGSDSNITEDLDGPSITDFYLNTMNFTSGGVVNRDPVLFATLSDPSGIKLSNSGVGRRLSLNIDGNVYNDLDIYYTPDPEDGTRGNLVYPISQLEPGKHSLSLVAWDNADNASVAELEFNVGAASAPVIYNLTTDVNPAKTSVVISVSVDRPMARLDCSIEVFDLMGRLVWSSDNSVSTDVTSRFSASWNLTDKAGHRVPRGIYLYRARVMAPEGTHTTATEKLAVTAP